MGENRVDDDASLAHFRARWLSPTALLAVISQWRVVLINGAVGVGKSCAMDDLLDESRRQGKFDLIIVLSELTRSLLERPLIQRMPPDVRRLRPRPKDDCGPLDRLWCSYERAGCAAYAKEHVCKHCQQYATCFWPGQYGEQLQGASVIFATHAQLQTNPFFIQHIQMVTKADNILLILDEAGFLEVSLRITLGRPGLCDMIDALRNADIREAVRDSWIYQTTLLTQAKTSDLRRADWKLPFLCPSEIVSLQEAGLALSPQFHFSGYQLTAFSRSRFDRRWADERGIHFVCPPYLAEHTVILSADMDATYVKRQLGVEVVHNPIPPTRIQHRDTRFFNLCSLMGAASRFRGNHAQILDCFAQLIIRNIEQGRMTILVSRKHLKQLCIQYLTQRLSQWGTPVELIAYTGGLIETATPAVIPVVHYGLCGINTLERYDAAYCLNSFYVDEDVLRQAIADVEENDLQFPVNIRLVGNPRRRVAGSFEERFRASDADETCRTYYRQLETNVVIQAVGRVRFATRPREVITFQASSLPGISLTREFFTLAEMRQHFGLLPGAEMDRQKQRAEAIRLRQAGYTTQQIAEAIGVSERTVRYRLASMAEERS